MLTASAWSDTLPGGSGVQPLPGAPTGLTATPGNRQVLLTWTGPTHTSITEWQFKRGQILEPLTAWAGWRSISTAATTRSYRVQTGLENGKSYIFQVRVRNAGGWSAAARSDTVALPLPCLLAGPTAPTMAENTAVTTAVGTYTASGDCGSESSWGLSGTDASWFELKAVPALSSSQTLHFKNPPNFEQPDDNDDQNTYEVTVSGGDGTASVSVSVSVTDANDAGHIGLSTTTPRAGQPLTATLSDADGVEEPVYSTVVR